MDISLDTATDLPLSGSATVQLGQRAVVLRLELDEAEALDGIQLNLVRAPEIAVPPTALTTSEITTDGPALPFSSLTWVAADWGETRTLDRLSLTFTAKPNPLTVRLKIARGQSSWYPPPGPHQFEMAAATTLTGAFPNTVADRLMLEFFVDNGASAELPATVSVTDPSPLSLTYGQHARDISVGLLGRRTFFRGSGDAPREDGASIEGLLEHLREQLDEDLRGQTIEIEVRAKVAGEAILEWELTSHQIEEYFEADVNEDSFAITWGETTTRPLPLPPSTISEVLGLDLLLTSLPSPQRVILAPNADPLPIENGQLARPLYDVAQALTILDPRPLAAIDIYTIPLQAPIQARLGLHQDDAGRPSAAPLIEFAPQIIDASSSDAAWISFPLARPQTFPAAPFWLVLSVDEGELSWLVEDPRPQESAALLFRRDGGLWLTRANQGQRPWAMARLRVQDETPPAPLVLELVGYLAPAADGDQVPDFIEALTHDEDGHVRWSPSDPANVPELAELRLRITSAAATAITLSKLELLHRPADG